MDSREIAMNLVITRIVIPDVARWICFLIDSVKDTNFKLNTDLISEQGRHRTTEYWKIGKHFFYLSILQKIVQVVKNKFTDVKYLYNFLKSS